MSETDEKTGHDVETAPPKTDDNGVAMKGDYPVNRLLRSEALARAGKATDPDGLVADDVIASAGERIAAEDAEREAIERAKPSMRWTRDQLLAHATGPDLGLTIETDANKETILAAIEAAPAKGA